jgi:DeoR/GlpR family transcriptional regulator of sugar metabolism
VVADSSKFGHQSLAHLCPLAAVNHLVTDSGASEAWRNKIQAAGVDVQIAAAEGNGSMDHLPVKSNQT